MTTTDPTPASMGEPLSEAERIAEIQARLDAATPGPWSTEYDSYGDEWWFGGTGAGQNTINFPNGSRAGVLGGDCRAEAELIANAPGDIAYLLERNALLEGQLATAQRLLDEQRGATRVAAAAADRFRDVLSEALGHPDDNPGDDVLVVELRKHFGFSGPEPTRWRDFLTGARARIDQIEADRSALGLDGGDPDAE